LPTAGDEPSSPPVSAVKKKQALFPVARKAGIFLDGIPDGSSCRRLFYLFYQVEIWHHQLSSKYISPTAAADSAQLPCNYGNQMDRLSPGDGGVGSAGVKCRLREPERRADAIRRWSYHRSPAV
jgi:hypothetical protein